MEIVETEFTLDELVSGVETVFGLKCQEKGLRFALRADTVPKQRVYVGDAHRIRQILNNLVSNAVKFTDCGSIDVTIREAAGMHTQTPELEFVVSDTGIGIGAETAMKLFAPFVQADSSITRRFGGTGLGLSICKRLCDMMKGRIDVSSQEGFGSTFRFVIPVEIRTLKGVGTVAANIQSA
jgi:signal transduction histidine kinase